MSKTLDEYVRGLRLRKGPVRSVDNHGSAWDGPKGNLIDDYQHEEQTRKILAVSSDHYRSDHVVVRLNATIECPPYCERWATELEGGPACTTVEQLAVLIQRAMREKGPMWLSGMTLGDEGFQRLCDIFPGLPISEPAPDEVPA